MSLRSKRVLAGIGGAVLLAAVIVAIGSLAGGGGGAGRLGEPVASRSLPPGHAAVNVGAEPTADSSMLHGIVDLKKQTRARPRDVAVLLKLGDAYFLIQRYALAEKTFRTVLRLKPGYSAGAVRLAMVWHAHGDTDRAVNAIKSVIKDHPQNQEAHYSLAILYFSTEHVDAARDQWAMAASIDPATVIGKRSRNFVQLIDGERPSRVAGEGD
jgi:cytochrome c-type biogenesis protein CcmH/NrfG